MHSALPASVQSSNKQERVRSGYGRGEVEWVSQGQQKPAVEVHEGSGEWGSERGVRQLRQLRPSKFGQL